MFMEQTLKESRALGKKSYSMLTEHTHNLHVLHELELAYTRCVKLVHSIA